MLCVLTNPCCIVFKSFESIFLLKLWILSSFSFDNSLSKEARNLRGNEYWSALVLGIAISNAFLRTCSISYFEGAPNLFSSAKRNNSNWKVSGGQYHWIEVHVQYKPWRLTNALNLSSAEYSDPVVSFDNKLEILSAIFLGNRFSSSAWTVLNCAAVNSSLSATSVSRGKR